jgi:4-methylaminobutanoate oxidase (formaldehyde-forming)
MVAIKLKDPTPMMYHNEPIFKDDKIIGKVTSGMYSHTLGTTIGLGYVYNESEGTGNGVSPDWIAQDGFAVEIACERFEVTLSLKPLYDPKAERVKV